MSKLMALKPKMSEKAYGSSATSNTYVFEVPMTANKVTVKQAVTKQFSVEVETVNILVSKGKPKKSYQKRNRPIEGRRADKKQAYVRLKEGQSINIFGAIEEAEKKQEKLTKQLDKKAAKAAKKESK